MRRFVPVLLILAAAAAAKGRIAYIEFLGAQGIDTEAIRKALPVHVGDPFTPEVFAHVAEVVFKVAGREFDAGGLCCTAEGDTIVDICFSSPDRLAFHAAPHENVALTPELAALYHTMRDAETASVMNGTAKSDGTPGYRLGVDPAARAAELRVREYALAHQDELLRAIRSGEAEQRQIAADVLGYSEPSERRTAALTDAVLDPDNTVRNNATRALVEMARADIKLAAGIPPDHLIDLLRFGSCTDRNKSSALLEMMTRSRDPQLLKRLKDQAWDSLMELARWHDMWQAPAREMAARIAGIPEERVKQLDFVSPEEFLRAVPYSTTLAPERQDR